MDDAAAYNALEKQAKPQNTLNGQMIAACWFQWSSGQEASLDDSPGLLAQIQMYLFANPQQKKAQDWNNLEKLAASQLLLSVTESCHFILLLCIVLCFLSYVVYK